MGTPQSTDPVETPPRVVDVRLSRHTGSFGSRTRAMGLAYGCLMGVNVGK